MTDNPEHRPAAGLDPEMLEMVLATVDRIRTDLLPRDKVLLLDREETFPEDLIRTLLSPDIGLQLLFIPEEYGGMGGGAADSCTVVRAMAGICLGVSTAFFALELGAEPILLAGTPAQKEKWLGKISAGEALVAYAVTEPEAGSNLAALKTRAEPVSGDHGIAGYRLHGAKQFISTGGHADFLTVLAQAPEGPTFFIVEKGAPGFCAGKPEHKHGIRASATNPLTFDNVFVPLENLVGGVPGLGLKQAGSVFARTRLMVGAMALGAGERALSIVRDYARQRIQFGSPLSEKQGYVHKLVIPHVARLAAAGALVADTARRYDRGEAGEDTDTRASMAKYLASEFAVAAADHAVQALGGYGYTCEYEVEKIRRDTRITTIYEGTSEIQQNIISLFRWKRTFKSKGGFYEDLALEMEGISRAAKVGAARLAAAARCVNRTFQLAHARKLTKSQAVMFALADMAAYTEAGCALAREAAENPDDERLCVLSRIFAAEAAALVGRKAFYAAAGAGLVGAGELSGFEREAVLATLWRAEAGLIADSDLAAAHFFGEP